MYGAVTITRDSSGHSTEGSFITQKNHGWTQVELNCCKAKLALYEAPKGVDSLPICKESRLDRNPLCLVSFSELPQPDRIDGPSPSQSSEANLDIEPVCLKPLRRYKRPNRRRRIARKADLVLNSLQAPFEALKRGDTVSATLTSYEVPPDPVYGDMGANFDYMDEPEIPSTNLEPFFPPFLMVNPRREKENLANLPVPLQIPPSAAKYEDKVEVLQGLDSSVKSRIHLYPRLFKI